MATAHANWPLQFQFQFQISLPCKRCKWTKHYLIIFYMTDLEGSENLFYHLRVGGGRGEEGVHDRFITFSFASFFSFRFLSL